MRKPPWDPAAARLIREANAYAEVVRRCTLMRIFGRMASAAVEHGRQLTLQADKRPH